MTWVCFQTCLVQVESHFWLCIAPPSLFPTLSWRVPNFELDLGGGTSVATERGWWESSTTHAVLWIVMKFCQLMMETKLVKSFSLLIFTTQLLLYFKVERNKTTVLLIPTYLLKSKSHWIQLDLRMLRTRLEGSNIEMLLTVTFKNKCF